MLSIPIQFNPTQYDLFLILEDDNIARLKAYDPAEIVLDKLPPSFHDLKLRYIEVCYATAAEVVDMVSTSDVKDMLSKLKKLGRGWKYMPEKGDSDAPYQTPQKN